MINLKKGKVNLNLVLAILKKNIITMRAQGYADRIYQERSRFAYSGTKDDPFGINSPIDINNKWVGKKVLVYDTNEEIENGIYTVRCEVWVDKNAEQSIHDPSMQNWQLM